MKKSSATLAAFIFALLGAIHVYWAKGGGFGSAAVIPERDGKPAFTPGPAATLAVAGGLFAACAVMVDRSGSVRLMPRRLSRLGSLTLALIFAGRAVGNFSTVGFSKGERGTKFATLDDRVYSPLCALLSALSLGASL